MRFDRSRAALALVAWLTLPAVLAGCSSKKSSAPTGPGGGGGGGTTLDSGPMASGASYSFTFADSGVFGYRCGIHPVQMNGYTVTVTSTSSVDSVLVSIVSTAAGMNPGAATIRIGGRIRWVNNDGINHSIESE